MVQKRNKKDPKKTDAYAEVTARLLAQMEQGVLPWTKPWTALAGAAAGLPMNGATERQYSGINILSLWLGGWCSPRWYSYRQALELGGQVQRGERGARILFYRMLEKEDRASGEVEKIPMARLYSVFNEEQIAWADGAPGDIAEVVYPDVRLVLEALGADVRSGGGRAYYSPAEDYIRLPAFEAFGTEERYWATALHEVVHWTGASCRLDREFGPKGSEAYAFEELVAEIGAAFLCARLGIPAIDRHAGAYLQHWMAQGRQDKRAFGRAARLAQQAADYVLDVDAVRTRASEAA